MSERRRILVTAALPYANGPIHLGHLVEYVQTDIWVRFQKMRQHECYYVCADDAHGTAIMLRAQEEGISSEELIERMEEEHQRDFGDFGIAFDYYHSTHSEENRELVKTIWDRVQKKGHVTSRTVRQFFDPERGIFLPDRFIRGTCPVCGAPDQYGDSCEKCSATYSPGDLVDPISVLSGVRPVEKDSEHFFLKLSELEGVLRDWVTPDRLQEEVVNKLAEWFAAGLKDWDISREAPYFGFEIPGAPGKYFYVWVDAPVGYMASFKALCDRSGLDFDDFWSPESTAELYHFIGKDILYFHCLFWPAMLHAADFRLPSAVWVHGFLTVNGEKMSKSRGTFVTARTYLERLDPDQLRYYYAAKLGSGLSDLDLSLDDFVTRVNADLVGKVVNIASRCAGFIRKRFDGRLADRLDDSTLFAEIVGAGEEIAALYEKREYNHAIRSIMALADRANRYIDEKKPWIIAREEGREEELQRVCTTGLNLFRTIVGFLKPVIPRTAEGAEHFLSSSLTTWEEATTPLLDHTIRPYEPLMTRVETEALEEMLEASKTEPTKKSGPAAAGPLADEPIADEIPYEHFARLDLRVARIVEAGNVDGADRLLRLRLDLGGEERTVFAGIKEAYDAAALEGRLTIVVANLAPKKMRFGVSEGMVLAAGPGGDEIYLLSPDSGAEPGMRVK